MLCFFGEGDLNDNQDGGSHVITAEEAVTVPASRQLLELHAASRRAAPQSLTSRVWRGEDAVLMSLV